ncbi:MAG: hypothetical protein ACKVON_11700, partial [Beijerinckiaceae bacterium]
RLWISAFVILISPLCFEASAQSVGSLDIAEKNRVVANKESFLILVLDLKPNAEALKSAGTGSTGIIIATAEKYAKDYLSRTEYVSVPKAVVYLISVDSMDEYNRANFNGMKRYGTITYERKAAEITLVENKLSYLP